MGLVGYPWVAKAICLIRQIFREISFVFLALVIILLFLILSILLVLPLLIFRFFIVANLAKIFKRDLLDLVPVGSCTFAVDNITSKPRNNILIWFTVRGSVELERFRREVSEKLLCLKRGKLESSPFAYPQLRQHYANFFGYLFYKWDKNFKIENHIKWFDYEDITLNYPIKEEHIFQIAPRLSEKPWKEGESPWEFLFVKNSSNDENQNEDEDEGRNTTICILRYNHGLGDGYSLLKMLLSNLAGVKYAKIAQPKYIERNFFQAFFYGLFLPFRIPYELGKQLVEACDSNVWCLGKNQISPNHYCVHVEGGIPMAEIKKIKKAHGVSFLSVLVASISGAIRATMIEAGQKVPKAMSACNAVPIPGHPDNKLVNHLTYLEIKFPVGEENSRKRLLASEKNLIKLKNSTLPHTNFYLSRLLGALPNPLIWILRSNLLTNTLISSNFPGPEHKIKFLDYEIESIACSDGIYYGIPGVTILMVSYAGRMRISININKGIVKSEKLVKKFPERILEELNSLKIGNYEKV